MHFFLSVNLPYLFSLNFHFIFWIDLMKFMIWISFHLLVFLIHVVWVANLEATSVSRQFPKAITFVDLKQMKCQFSLQQRWVYLRSPGNFNLGVCNHGNLSASSPHGKGKITLFYRGKGSKRTIVNLVLGFSLTESLSGKKRSLSSSCSALLFSKDLRVPLFWFPPLFNWDFCL